MTSDTPAAPAARHRRKLARRWKLLFAVGVAIASFVAVSLYLGR
jgi:hypothetical protein